MSESVDSNFGPDIEPIPTTECERLRFQATDDLVAGRVTQARQNFQSAIEVGLTELGHRHPHVALALVGLADLTQDLGEAERLRFRALAALDGQALYAGLSVVLLMDIARPYRRRGDFETAESFYRQAVEVGEANPQAGGAFAQLGLAVCLEARGEPERAAQLRDSAREYCDQHGSKLFARGYSAPVLPSLREGFPLPLEDYLDVAYRAVERREDVCGRNHPLVAQELTDMAMSLRRVGHDLEAEALEKRVFEIQARIA